ncbi:MAG: orotidine-5'-phosphate decarboxylase [Halorhodospira halophila]|uniref:orotidine-5'-phosphate decarboxylase n=1 Tax=Halorhodospira TaxID=85108 RepID=UPI001911D4BA|nr:MULTISPECIES: orotidine-5'-phosphate decarboxylase [Halorhodospira]MBK5942880.1 orotidine-5'-phosphate decarboxylase [Halorhodospira halophila]MCC3750480.1 orotidine-5'-phosphate decarboxylase [Halorhodospira halophila]MCG5528752.1 orotidine-5'-phosphate decarboxylase [Halorhodospira halophila]MCG5534111.1 orotidine-5'-phosphate decarboxylase [Halorhodospira sp. 9621]MCG5539256.1 orotidine-5'-phosphate decarboxylase [Halorhodospira sp. 9622]
MNVPAGPRLIVALDFPAAAPAEALAAQLDPRLCRLKVGKELFTRAGPQLVERLQGRGFEVFLDLKYHDIPNTVAGACRAAAELGVWMVNVHALGGRRMLEAAGEAVAAADGQTLLTAVTVLTSHDAATLEEIGLAGPPREAVLRLAGLARSSGLDGVVCSPEEAAAIGERFGGGLLRVTPGVRPAGAAVGDQQRIATPAAAVAAGCDYLVVGRPITAADDPAAAAAGIGAEIAAAG